MVPGASWEIPSSSVLSVGNTPNNRVNCANLSDLPLCNQLEDNGVVGYPLKNCVKECSDASFNSGTGVRGSDFAVHDRDCVRFCDSVESGITPNPGVNCVSRSCHQVSYNITDSASNVQPSPTSPNPNCRLLPCKLLTPDELNDDRFRDSSTADYGYCDASAKCYEFTKAQLPYLLQTKRCKMHDCRVTCVNNATDDIQKIMDKGTDFVNSYKTFINAGYEIGGESDIMCSNIICKPIVKKRITCTGTDTPPSIRNSDCDLT